jgi:poly(A) polymerase
MMAGSLRFLLGVGTAAIGVIAAASSEAQPRACQPPQAMREGWSTSFVAGCTDRNGKVAGGSQIIHLVIHKGKLYGANGYWKDARNIWYGGGDRNAGWGQVLQLSGPNEPWVVDLDLGPRHLRTELLKSVTFTQDANGRPLAAPEALLFASTYDGPGTAGVTLFVRNDETGSWTRSKIISGNTGKKGEDNSVRAAAVYRDRVTGLEQLFISVGVLGVFTGQYDPSRRGTFKWSQAPESGPTGTRTLSIVEANDSLFFSDGTRILRRIDGQTPRYAVVVDLSSEIDAGTNRGIFQSIGGIRGLSALQGPVPNRQSLVFVWTSGKKSRGCVFRLDPQPDGSYGRVREICLADLVSRHLDGATVNFVLGAYNSFMPLRDPQSNELLHLIGMEAHVSGRAQATVHKMSGRSGGIYAGAMYALRDTLGRWRIGEVNGKYQPGQPELESIYTSALSPFNEPGRQTIYVGGYDPNDFPSSDTAWVSSTDLANLVRR